MSFRGNGGGRRGRGPPRGRGGFRGGGGGNFKNYNNDRDFGDRHRDYSQRDNRHRPSKHGDDLLANLDPNEQIELTRALVASVLKNDGGRERDNRYRGGFENRRGRDYGDRDGGRPFRARGNFERKYDGRSRDSRHYDDDRGSYSGAKPFRGSNYRGGHDKMYYGREKRDASQFERHDDGAPHKRMRTDREDYYRGGDDYEKDKRDTHEKRSKASSREEKGSREKRDSDHVKKEKVKKLKKKVKGDDEDSVSGDSDVDEEKEDDDKSVKDKDDDLDWDIEDLENSKDEGDDDKLNGEKKEKKTREKDDDSKSEKSLVRGRRARDENDHEDDDDEEAKEKNRSRTRSHLSGRSRSRRDVEVKLECPHCPDQVATSFEEHKSHLKSRTHWSNLEFMSKKNYQVLKKIRNKQREEQKIIEDKWKEDDPETFKKVVSRYCNECLLAFKVHRDRTDEGKTGHRKSKLHRMQVKFMRPKCNLCNMVFPRRMVYENHRSSITHLKVKALHNDATAVAASAAAAKAAAAASDTPTPVDAVATDDGDEASTGAGERVDGKDGDKKVEDQEDQDKLDLDNFITMDSVGGEEEESDAELANIIEEVAHEYRDRDERKRKRSETEEVPLEMTVADDENIQEDASPKGEEHVVKIEASYCKLCHKVIRTDSSIGEEAIVGHCKASSHLEKYRKLHREKIKIEKEEKVVSEEPAIKEDHDEDGDLPEDESQKDELEGLESEGEHEGLEEDEGPNYEDPMEERLNDEEEPLLENEEVMGSDGEQSRSEEREAVDEEGEQVEDEEDLVEDEDLAEDVELADDEAEEEG